MAAHGWYTRAEVIRVTGLSKSTIHRREKDGTFPGRRAYSKGLVGYKVSEVHKWLADRPLVDARREEPAPVPSTVIHGAPSAERRAILEAAVRTYGEKLDARNAAARRLNSKRPGAASLTDFDLGRIIAQALNGAEEPNQNEG
jgi:predicted DNA-binding transcriptional regulator AlpA